MSVWREYEGVGGNVEKWEGVWRSERECGGLEGSVEGVWRSGEGVEGRDCIGDFLLPNLITYTNLPATNLPATSIFQATWFLPAVAGGGGAVVLVVLIIIISCCCCCCYSYHRRLKVTLNGTAGVLSCSDSWYCITFRNAF